jgi:hypothetical protein
MKNDLTIKNLSPTEQRDEGGVLWVVCRTVLGQPSDD